MTSFEMKNAINRMKKEKNAVIAAHNYQVDEIQEIADIVGDSFALSRFCAEAAYDVIVFCGVHFMAESAKILSPHKTVLLPESDAGCPMADMVDPESLKKAKLEHLGAAVVCYINSSAAVKAESDVCCTSSNAVRIVSSMKEKDIIFVPDCNLAGFVAKQVPDKNIIPWKGFCITHHRVRKEDVLKAKEVHPDAVLLVHPECRPEVAAMADFVGSTSQIIDYASKSSKSKFIIGTEMGVMYKLKNDNPGKQFFLLSQGLVCPNMKKNTLKSVYNSLNEMRYVIEVDEVIRLKAVKALQRMLEMA